MHLRCQIPVLKIAKKLQYSEDTQIYTYFRIINTFAMAKWQQTFIQRAHTKSLSEKY